MSTKLCKTCLVEHKIEDFYVHKGGYIETTCKFCRRKASRDDYNNNPYKYWAKNTRQYHESKGIRVDMSVEQIEKAARAHGHCQMCGKSLYYGRKRNGVSSGDSPTLDRINNQMYINENNVFITCLSCNASKRDRSLKEFVAFCKMIYEKFGKDD